MAKYARLVVEFLESESGRVPRGEIHLDMDWYIETKGKVRPGELAFVADCVKRLRDLGFEGFVPDDDAQPPPDAGKRT